MDVRFLKNSYVVLIIVFIITCIIFYIFGIGFVQKKNINGESYEKFTYKYPIAIALLSWVGAHYFLFPEENSQKLNDIKPPVQQQIQPQEQMGGSYNIPNKAVNINMNRWV